MTEQVSSRDFYELNSSDNVSGYELPESGRFAELEMSRQGQAKSTGASKGGRTQGLEDRVDDSVELNESWYENVVPSDIRVERGRGGDLRVYAELEELRVGTSAFNGTYEVDIVDLHGKLVYHGEFRADDRLLIRDGDGWDVLTVEEWDESPPEKQISRGDLEIDGTLAGADLEISLQSDGSFNIIGTIGNEDFAFGQQHGDNQLTFEGGRSAGQRSVTQSVREWYEELNPVSDSADFFDEYELEITDPGDGPRNRGLIGIADNGNLIIYANVDEVEITGRNNLLDAVYFFVKDLDSGEILAEFSVRDRDPYDPDSNGAFDLPVTFTRGLYEDEHGEEPFTTTLADVV